MNESMREPTHLELGLPQKWRAAASFVGLSTSARVFGRVAVGKYEESRKVAGAPAKNPALAHFDRLMKQGTGNSEACRIAGISHSYGTC